MIASIDTSLIDWSRAQFALTAMYHWLFVPLTLGLGVIQAIMETIYYKTGNEFWKKTAQFWMKLFGINFAIGVATGLILEFEFGTNWSNYSWFVGDIFGAPLAIEGILAFFMEATFIAVMFFGWDKVSKRFHLASTWLTIIGATLSALWILIAKSGRYAFQSGHCAQRDVRFLGGGLISCRHQQILPYRTFRMDRGSRLRDGCQQLVSVEKAGDGVLARKHQGRCGFRTGRFHTYCMDG